MATNQNGLQPVERYALKYRSASLKSESSIFFYVILDFFCEMLAYFCLSFILLIFLSSVLSVVISFYSVLFFSFLLLHCIKFFMHHFLLLTFLLFILLPTFLAFPSFLFLFTSSSFSPFKGFLCSHVYLLKERVCTLRSYASHSCASWTISIVREQRVVITDVSRSLPLLGQTWQLEGQTVPEMLQCSWNSITKGDVLLLDVDTTACSDTGDQ
jgi:hypothetical protein